jgi:disulfide oxidoreductase YuzD
MRNYLIILFGLVLFSCFSCKKYRNRDYYTGYCSGTRNGKPWTASSTIIDYGNSFGIFFDKYGNSKLIEEGSSILPIKKNYERQFFHNSIIPYFDTLRSNYYVMVKGDDVVCASYSVDTTTPTSNYCQITFNNGKYIKGIFNCNYIDYDPNPNCTDEFNGKIKIENASFYGVFDE